MTRPKLQSMCPFSSSAAWRDQSRSIATSRVSKRDIRRPARLLFFAIVGRDGAQLFVNAGHAAALPNSKRDPAMRWDAYVFTQDPDGLAAEFTERGATFSVPLKDTHDGLRGFELADPDGYVLFFGRPA